MGKEKLFVNNHKGLSSKQPPFVTKYARPKKFSNPYEHFSSKDLSEILEKPDKKLEWFDFNKIFHYETPAGTYPEIVYFLPWALHYLATHSSDLSEFFGSLAYFISTEEKKLRKDKLFVSCINVLNLIFKYWTSTFNVIHFDREACKRKQWNLDYDDIVEHSQEVSEFIDTLCRRENLSAVAADMVKLLADITNEPIRSAWILEYIYSVRKAYQMYAPANFPGIPDEMNMTPTKNIPVIFEIVSDNDLARKHFLKIENSVIALEESPTYWKDLKNYLGI